MLCGTGVPAVLACRPRAVARGFTSMACATPVLHVAPRSAQVAQVHAPLPRSASSASLRRRRPARVACAQQQAVGQAAPRAADSDGSVAAPAALPFPQRPRAAASLVYLYDGGCRVCLALVSFLRSRNGTDKIFFVNLAAPDYAAASNEGIAKADAMKTIHVIVNDGSRRVLTGMGALEALYGAVGLGWLMQLATLPLLSWLAEIAYKWVSQNRVALGGGFAFLETGLGEMARVGATARGEGGCAEDGECRGAYAATPHASDEAATAATAVDDIVPEPHAPAFAAAVSPAPAHASAAVAAPPAAPAPASAAPAASGPPKVKRKMIGSALDRSRVMGIFYSSAKRELAASIVVRSARGGRIGDAKRGSFHVAPLLLTTSSHHFFSRVSPSALTLRTRRSLPGRGHRVAHRARDVGAAARRGCRHRCVVMRTPGTRAHEQRTLPLPFPTDARPLSLLCRAVPAGPLLLERPRVPVPAQPAAGHRGAGGRARGARHRAAATRAVRHLGRRHLARTVRVGVCVPGMPIRSLVSSGCFISALTRSLLGRPAGCRAPAPSCCSKKTWSGR